MLTQVFLSNMERSPVSLKSIFPFTLASYLEEFHVFLSDLICPFSDFQATDSNGLLN
jgi:hypothetical protein